MSQPVAHDLPESCSCSVSLRIRHPSCDPDDITKELGLTPDHSWARGEPRRSEGGLQLGGVRHDSYWVANVPGVSTTQWQTEWQTGETDPKLPRAMLSAATGDLPGAMAQLQMQLQIMAQIRRNRGFLERLIGEGGEVTFVMEVQTVAGMSFRLDPALMKQLGALGVRLELEFV